ncbi:MAG: hypothetical protein ABSA46_18160 [Thermodesulfovibrionales bacterium]|jgi:hypothetical protein
MFKKTLIVGLLLVTSVFAVQAAYAQGFNLTGTWQCTTDGSLYYIRQVNDEVWWYGEQMPTNPSFSNTAHGTFDGVIALMLNWADVPKGSTSSNGILLIEVTPPTATAAAMMMPVYQTGGFGCGMWNLVTPGF